MQNSTLFRRAAALLLTAALALTLVLPGLAAYEMPIQTVNEGESVYLFNADIDKPILEQNADQQRYIASLTKMMTALLFLESGKDMHTIMYLVWKRAMAAWPEHMQEIKMPDLVLLSDRLNITMPDDRFI